MSYNYFLFNKADSEIDPKDFGEHSFLTCISSLELRRKISEQYTTQWYGIGEDYCWGRHSNSKEKSGAEFKIYGGEIEQGHFAISGSWDIVTRMSKTLSFWIYDPQECVIYDSNGKEV